MDCVSEGSGSTPGLAVFERQQLYKWTKESGCRNFTDRIKFVKSKLARRYDVMEREFSSFAHQLKERWHKCKSRRISFERRNRDWLKGSVKLGCIRAESFVPEVENKPKPIVFAKAEVVPEDAVFDNELESVCSEPEVREEILKAAAETREPELFVEFECEAPSMSSRNPTDSAEFRSPVTYGCNLCQYTCLQEEDLMQHKKIHVSDEQFACDQCQYRCRLEYELQVHKTSQHIMSQLYHCSKCDYFCRNRKNMAMHQEIHLSLKQYHCDTCNYRSQKSACGMSGPSNTADPYLCDQCGICCTSKDTFNRHLSSHSRKALLCSDMSDRNRQLDLQNHMPRMSEMLYACDRCQYICRDEFDFGKHLLSCAKEKSTRSLIYACNLCDFRCQYPDSLKGHIMTHLSEETTFSGEDSASSLDLE